LRGDNASPHTMENARRKAYTARSFRTSTTAYAKRFADNDSRHCQINLSRSKKARSRTRDYAAATAFRHSRVRLGSEDPQRRPRDEMALKVEGVVNGGVHAEEALSGSSRFEPLHLALSSPYRLMRVLCAIVAPKPLFVRIVQS
jgi:hypothetical protein